MRHTHLKLLACLALLVPSSCGVNVLTTGEKKDPAEDATLALEKSEESEAIDILEAALADDPENPQLLSILALAYAQRAGVEPLAFAQRMAANEGTSEEGGAETGTSTGQESNDSAGLIALFDIMPEATEDNLEDIDRAVEILVSEIAPADRTSGDLFKLAIYQTAALVLHLKALDTDGDGTLSIEEITDLSNASALAIVQQLAMASASLATDTEAAATTQAAAAALEGFQADIDAMPGETDDERLRYYLAVKSGLIEDQIDGVDTSTPI
jgi:hypothetical protein